MFDEIMNQLADAAFESSYQEPETWVEEWPDDLWDE
jgi:hypothetical protein